MIKSISFVVSLILENLLTLYPGLTSGIGYNSLKSLLS
jgi:hypothetical protein